MLWGTLAIIITEEALFLLSLEREKISPFSSSLEYILWWTEGIWTCMWIFILNFFSFIECGKFFSSQTIITFILIRIVHIRWKKNKLLAIILKCDAYYLECDRHMNHRILLKLLKIFFPTYHLCMHTEFSLNYN